MNAITRKAKVTPAIAAEAQALTELWASRPHSSQAVFGETFDIGNQSAVGQFLRGEIPLSPKAAFGFAKGLGCSIADFSPRLANMFPVSHMALEQALQCFASHLKPLNDQDRGIAAGLIAGMMKQPEKTEVYISSLLPLLSTTFAEKTKAELLSAQSPVEAMKASMRSARSPLEDIEASLRPAKSPVEAAKVGFPLPPTAIAEDAKK